ncbi:MAG: hypothetical protein KDD35_11125 [Bdellovibrionales bacterium]|nr:hypothetical protein [Bdellovibrionales bacterium]
MVSIFVAISFFSSGFLFGFAYYRARELRGDIERGLAQIDSLSNEQKEFVLKRITETMPEGSLFEKMLRK